MTDETPVLVRRDRAVVEITLNRPAARNAMNLTLTTALWGALEEAEGAACVIITGADPAFCAGLDLRDLGTHEREDLPRCAERIAAAGIPTIAAVNGPAVTGGLELALACDFIIASERAAFADTHLRVGVYPGPVLVDLPRRIGLARAREFSLTGNFVDSVTAERIGLANRVVNHEDLLPVCRGLATAIAEQDRRMVADMRREWEETATLPRGEAQRQHSEFAKAAGYRTGGAETLAANRQAVLERSRQQRAVRDRIER